MVRSVTLSFLTLLLFGCSSIPKVDRFYTEPFCYPKLKFDRDSKKVYGGVACKF